MPAEQRQEMELPEYPIFKGLQRPLEFMGLRGRYIYWAAMTAGGAIMGFIIAYCLLGIVAGLIVLVVVISTGISMIFIKQKRGLHTKKIDKGIFVYAFSKKL